MKQKVIALLGLCALAASLLAGCTKAAPANSASGSQAAVQTRWVPVLDTQYADILNDYHLVGSFHDGVAFAARYLPMTEEDYQQDYPMPRVECGYLTLEGEYTPLYVVPSELELIDPCADMSNLHGESFETFATTEEGLAIFYGDEPECSSMPSLEQQIALDDTFTVGDNGWVPYYENGKWGYCDLNGQVQLAPAYDFVSPFSDGKALVCQYADKVYAWSIIDEAGSEIAALDPEYRFALRKMGGEFVFCYDKVGVRIYNMEGEDLSQGEVMTLHYLEQDGYALAGDRVYGPDGELYRAEDIQPVGVQEGCTVYADGSLYGIRGSDGQVRCPARFDEICRLAPEGFYAREGSNQVNLYDYDGNLLQEAAPCVRIVSQNNGFTLYDGQGNTMEQYISQDNAMARYMMTGGTFITEDSFVYLYLSEQERTTLHITFEEQTVDQAASQPAQSQSEPESFSQLQVREGESFSIKRTAMPYARLNNLSFLDWDFDSLSAVDRCAVWSIGDACTGGLEWYETMDHEVVVCDENFQTVFTVPQETVEWLHDPTATASDPEGFYAYPRLFYAGDGLWNLQLEGLHDQGAVYVFDRQGNMLVEQKLEKAEDAFFLTLPSAYANEGYWFFGDSDDRFYTMDGQTIPIRFGEEEPVESYTSLFDGGLANTPHGYVDTQGNVVLSAQTLQENIEEYLQCQVEPYHIILRPFDGETAWIDVTVDFMEDIYKKLEIDRTGKVLAQEDTQESFSFFYEGNERGDEIKNQMLLHMVDQPFYIVEQNGHTGEKLFTASGQQVTGPEGVYFGTALVQWDERFAFVEQTFMSGENCFIPVDVSGRVYDEFSQKWDRIYASPGGKVYGVKEIKGDRGLTDHCEVTPLEITLS